MYKFLFVKEARKFAERTNESESKDHSLLATYYIEYRGRNSEFRE